MDRPATGRIRRRLLPIAMLSGALALTGCSASVSVGSSSPSPSGSGTSNAIDGANVATTITSVLRKGVGPDVPVTIDCPPGVEVKSGATFECTGTVDNQSIVFVVTQKDDAGNVTFRPNEALINLKAADTAIAKDAGSRFGGTFTVTCTSDVGSAWYIGLPGTTFTCAASSAKASKKVVVTVKDSAGNVGWLYS